MNSTEIILFALFISTLFVNIFFLSHQRKLRNLLNEIIKESNKLQSLLTNSTSNLDKLLQENKTLWNQVESLKKNNTNLLSIFKGDRVIFKESLRSKKNNHTFDVLYECEVIETTEKKLKLSAIDFSSEDDWANKERQSIISYLQNKWVDRKDCNIIIDQKHLRDSKLNDLLNGIEDSN